VFNPGLGFKFPKKKFAVLLVALSFVFSLGLGSGLQAKALGTDSHKNAQLMRKHHEVTYIPLEKQPIYGDLLQKQAEGEKSVILEATATGPSATDTFVDFYTHITSVYDQLIPYYTDPGQFAKGGPFWSKEEKVIFSQLSELLSDATKSLDTSSIPESIRPQVSPHRAIQLKEIFDYIFTHATEPIQLESKSLPEGTISNDPKSGIIEFPQSPITLSNRRSPEASSQSLPLGGSKEGEYLFTSDTVDAIPGLYELIRKDIPIHSDQRSNKFFTPGFYKLISETPGNLIAPKWYLQLPPNLRAISDIAFGENTLIQIGLTAAFILIYIVFTAIIFIPFSKTYQRPSILEEALSSTKSKQWISLQDKDAWLRLILLVAFLIATTSCLNTIVDYANITGTPILVITNIFNFIYYLGLSFTSFLLFEALGRVLSDLAIAISPNMTLLDLSMVSGSIMPASRLIGIVFSVYYVYKLLLSFGLPPSTILAFSAVPGLAIGLGASKMLANLIAGLVIQTDRPIRVGDFVDISGTKGFVSQVGLRSIRLETPSLSLITIPNAKADEANIHNFMITEKDSNNKKYRAYEIVLTALQQKVHSPEDVKAIGEELKAYLSAQALVKRHLVVAKPSIVGDPAKIVCKVYTTARNWVEHDEIVVGYNNMFVALDAKYPGTLPEPEKVLLMPV
jgi:MscS family membrane protein